MNSDQIQGKWKQLKGAARQQFGKLTDDDIEVIAGQRDKLIGKLQERYGYAREEAQKRADEFFASSKEEGQQAQQMPPASAHGASQGSHKR
jgi:uncharacterized protein YjbJ (UPF0337 family)